MVEENGKITCKFINEEKCTDCGACLRICPDDAIILSTKDKKETFYIKIDHEKCTLCGKCTEVCPTSALSITGEERSTEWVVDELLKDRVFFKKSNGGITLTGGDPLYQHEFTLSILKAIKKYKIHTAVETAMFSSEEVLLSLVPYTNLFLVDIKILDNELHMKSTGVDNRVIKRNFESLAARAKNIIVRVPLIPGYTDNKKNLIAIRDYVRGIRKDIKIELLNFNPLARDKYNILDKPYPDFPEHRSFSEEEMLVFNNLLL